MTISIGDAELEVLKLLWERGAMTVREVCTLLESRGRDLAYTTVQTMLRRLADKGVVSMEKLGSVNRFDAVLSREQVVGEEVSHLIERYCDDGVAPLMLALVQQGHFSGDEIEEFRALLDRLDETE
jgi:predicted transcriptional regulator